MAKNLVIVESPAKAKTIEGYLGKDFLVKSSLGHIRDLAGKDLSVDTENNYEPNYVVPPDKKAVVTELKKLAKDAEMVWLATDEDREGEAISWHLYEALKLEEDKTKRIVFHEITKSAILNAIENPRNINIDLVNAQQARRVLDRLVGFELSPILWKKVKPSLSAGRVQSVAVRLIVDREKEIGDFKTTSSYRVVAIFNQTIDGKTYQVKAELPNRFEKKEEAQAFLEKCKTATFTVSNLEQKPSKKSPAAPFTTSTLQQEASRKLGFSVARTMMVAQKLYESGKITYMRTDSVNLSDLALDTAKAEIEKSYGAEYSKTRQYTSKTKNAQEAHEAIRPTYIQNHSIDGDNAEQRLYDLIWKRTVASQMADAQLEKTTATISISGSDETLVARGEVITFDGFLKVYMESVDDEQDDAQKGMLPPLETGMELKLDTLTATERFTQHPPRYTEASLVKKMEELGIGRPSTYAPTISTVQKRGYVEKTDREGEERKYILFELKGGQVSESTQTENHGAEKGKLFPTDIGIIVNDFLMEHFPDIMDYHFTAEVEEKFDEIANGVVEWVSMIDGFYKPFHETVDKTAETSSKATGQRLLGTDPESGRNVYVKIGRYGPMVQIGDAEEEEKPKFASLLKDQRLDSVNLEEALELFKLPRTVGEHEGKEVVAAIGRYGPYVRFDSKFYSLDKEDDPVSITLDRAVELIKAKQSAEEKKIIKEFPENEDIKVLRGRYGPYISAGKKNVKIPKDKDPESLTLQECLDLAEKAPEKKFRRGFKK